jgi:predicted PurR-regulated permease PerM
MKVKIEIDTRTFVRFWLVVIGFALAAFIIFSARMALIIIGAAIFLAIALSPSVNRLARMFPSKSRALGTALAYVVVVVALGLVVFLVIPPIIDQTVKFADNVPNLIDSATKQYSGISSFMNHYQLQPEFDKAITSIKDSASQFASGIGSILITSIGSVLSSITAAILILVLAFLMLVEGPTLFKQLWSSYGDEDLMEYHSHLLGRMYNVVTSYITGQLSVSAIAGSVSGILVLILSLIFNIPLNLAIPAATIVFVLSLIPLFGEIIGALIVGLILALNSITAGIVFIIFFTVYAQIEANIISPRIQSKRINLSALAILASVTIGIYLFGIIGGIISIPIAGCLNVLIEDYFAREKKKYIENKKSTKDQAKTKKVSI